MLSEIKILMIDDDDEDFIIVNDLWEEVNRHKYSIDWAPSYKDGLKYISEKKYDAYLVDYRLGADDGLELIREALKNGCEAPLILLTGQNDIEIDILAMKAGASDYLVKGTISPSQLERTIRYSIEQTKNLKNIKQAFETLKASEEKHKDIYQNSLVAMLTTDMKTFKAINVNNMAVNVFGYKSKIDFISNYDSSLHFENPNERKEIIETLMEIGEVRTGIHEMKKVDGVCFYGKMFIKLNREKTIAQTVIIDVTEQMRFQEELEVKVKDRTLELTDSLLREKELNEMKTRFVSFASHEFRTPLSAILSSSSLIEMYNKPEQEEQRLKHINRISSSVKHLTDILNDFLLHGELEQKNIDVKNSLFNLPEFINTVMEDMSGIVNEKKHIIYHHDGEVMIEQSSKILKNILLNLLSNASKYSPIEKNILLSSSVTNDRVSITVKDHGIGIPEEDQTKLFGQFFRAGNVEHIQGTGLGLAIVKKYIELINGHIEFISKSGEGTIFTIEFPQHNT